jgi:capsular exopolysaccharide synthesis family protein
MDIRAYIGVFWRRGWLIVITTTIAVVVVLIGTQQITPVYSASATVRMLTSSDGNVDYGKLQYVERLMNTYAQILQSGPVMTKLQQRLGITTKPDIAVEFPANTELMQIDVTDRNPTLAAEAANVLADILIEESQRTSLGREYAVSLVDPAVPPTTPSAPQTTLYLAIGVIIGMAGGLALIFLFENLDSTVYTAAHMKQATRLNIVGTLPTLGHEQRTAFLNGDSAEGEAVRRLRTHLLSATKTAALRTLLVTSPESGEGKSTIVSNLAYTIAKSGRTVIVIDADLRRPVLHERFQLPNTVGLSSVLCGDAKLDDALQGTSIPGLQVLTSGPLPTDAAALLDSPTMASVLQHLSQQAHIVLIDSPGFLSVPDAALLASQSDGVVLAVRLTRTQQDAAETTRQQLESLNRNLIGIVVNQVTPNQMYTYQ